MFLSHIKTLIKHGFLLFYLRELLMILEEGCSFWLVTWLLLFVFISRAFSFCQYPFLLSLGAKRYILQKDSESQMIEVARVSCI